MIAIIAILAGLLLPALNKAKAKAQGIQCLSNTKQLGLGWVMYTHDNADRVPPNNPSGCWPLGQPDYALTWVNGYLTLDGGAPDGAVWGRSARDNPDNTNTVYLMKSHLAPYVRSLAVWRCPADHSQSTLGGRRYPHVRTVAMNLWIGADLAFLSAVLPNTTKILSLADYRIIKKTTEMVRPAPVNTFVMLDQRDDSINDNIFLQEMDGFDPYVPGELNIIEYPSSYHNGAGGFNFADGHSEIKRWSDPRTNPPHKEDSHLQQFIPGLPSPGNVDVRWLQERATSRK